MKKTSHARLVRSRQRVNDRFRLLKVPPQWLLQHGIALPALQRTAREIGMSTRTLQRRLTDARLTFHQLVEDSRRELAPHYLKHSPVELNEIAFLLGYDHANTFFRAFQGWEGATPGEWRARHRA
jgi:AraC-like DNA-binding protein